MKRRPSALLSTISTVAVTAVLGMPAAALTQDVQVSAPIHRLASIRESYLAALSDQWREQSSHDDTDEVAQFRNFPNFPNFSNWRNR